MRIGILSGSTQTYSVNRLKLVARERDHTVRVLSLSKFSLDIKHRSPNILYKGKPLGKLDAIIPRVGASYSFVGSAIVRQFEQMGVFCLNASHAISVSKDKLRALQVLSRHRIGIPHSLFVLNKSDIGRAVDQVGGAPLIIKLIEGSQGAGVMLAESKSVAGAIVEALHVANRHVLIQKFVSESKGRDIRAFVVGDKVVSSMRRIAGEGEFRSNVHLGAEVEKVELEPEYEQAAVLASQIMGLRVAGVDLLESAEGPQVMEVNSSPGLKGIEEASGEDVAMAIINYLEEQITFPYLDVRERLSLSRGYAIVEIPVLKKGDLVGKTIEDSLITEYEIMALSITRGSITIPTPRKSEVLQPGDVLLCFGKQLALKPFMIPPKRNNKKRKDA